MNEIVFRNSLFFPDAHGDIQDTWSLFADDANDAYRTRATDWGKSKGLNGMVFCLNNEHKTSFFRNGYMKDFDWAKIAKALSWIQKWTCEGWYVIPAFFDGPAEPSGKYHPIIDQWDRHGDFIRGVCSVLNKYCVGYLIGCETNRYFSPGQVQTLVDITKEAAPGHFVGTHMCWDPDRYVFPDHLDFWAHEHSWHPKYGPDKTPEQCAAEIRRVKDRAPKNRPCIPMEWTLEPWTELGCRQSAEMAKIEDVVGLGGPLN